MVRLSWDVLGSDKLRFIKERSAWIYVSLELIGYSKREGRGEVWRVGLAENELAEWVPKRTGFVRDAL